MRIFYPILKLVSVGLVLVTLLAEGPLALASAQPRTSGSSPMVVIVSAQSKMQDISRSLLKRIFLGEVAEYEGVRFVPLNYSVDTPLRQAFDEVLLGFTGDAVGRYWVDRRIRGQGLPPRTVPSSSVVRVAVAKLRGAMGYIRAAELDTSVRALTIDGVAHTAPGYPLRSSL